MPTRSPLRTAARIQSTGDGNGALIQIRVSPRVIVDDRKEALAVHRRLRTQELPVSG